MCSCYLRRNGTAGATGTNRGRAMIGLTLARRLLIHVRHVRHVRHMLTGDTHCIYSLYKVKLLSAVPDICADICTDICPRCADLPSLSPCVFHEH